jgi:ribosomal protein L23
MVRLIPNFRVQLVHHEFVKTQQRDFVGKFGTASSKYATFHIEPRMTKQELAEYLRKVYSMAVTKVTTVNLPKKGDSSKVIKKAIVVYEYE